MNITFKSSISFYTEEFTGDYSSTPEVGDKVHTMIKKANQLGIELGVSLGCVEAYGLNGHYIHFDISTEGDKLTVRYFISQVVEYFRCIDDWNEQVCNNQTNNRFYIDKQYGGN